MGKSPKAPGLPVTCSAPRPSSLRPPSPQRRENRNCTPSHRLFIPRRHREQKKYSILCNRRAAARKFTESTSTSCCAFIVALRPPHLSALSVCKHWEDWTKSGTVFSLFIITPVAFAAEDRPESHFISTDFEFLGSIKNEKGIFNFMMLSPGRQRESMWEEQELPASATVGSCARVRLESSDNESDEGIVCNPDDASSGSICPPTVTPTSAGDKNESGEEMECNSDDASSGSIDPPIGTPASSANKLGALKEKHPFLARHATVRRISCLCFGD
jgi:hypothetical protein